jgi:hypothetical protein
MQPENKNNPQEQANPRVKKIEDFLLNPDKVVFESIEELSSAIATIIKIFEGVDLKTLEQLQGKDGKNAVRGVDYMNEDDLKAIEAFILSKVPVVGEDVPSAEQIRTFINDAVAKLPLQKGDKGDSFTFDDLTEEQKNSLKGQDGDIETTESILAKLRAAGKNQGLKIKDIRGLNNVVQLVAQHDADIQKLMEEASRRVVAFSQPQSEGTGPGGGGGTGDFKADGTVPMTGDFNANGNDIKNVDSIGLGGVTTPLSKMHIGNVAPNEYFATITDGNPGSTLFRIRRTFSSIDFSVFFGYIFKFGAPVEIPIQAYDATAWNGSALAVSQGAIRDKIESIVAASGITEVEARRLIRLYSVN